MRKGVAAMAGRMLYTPILDLYHLRMPDHLSFGYESAQDFRLAIRELVGRWGNRVGERIDERNGFYRLRFVDTPGGRPDEAWLPAFLLERVEDGEEDVAEDDGIEAEIDSAFGFD